MGEAPVPAVLRFPENSKKCLIKKGLLSQIADFKRV